MIAEELRALASHSTPVKLNPTESPNFGAFLQQYANDFTSEATQVLLTIDSTLVTLTRLVFVTLLLLGVFLYFTRLNRRFGKDLIYGGVILAIIAQIVFPFFNIS
jgi:hypothetical protein